MIGALRTVLPGGTDSTLVECRRCGTTLETTDDDCPYCGTTDVALYDVG